MPLLPAPTNSYVEIPMPPPPPCDGIRKWGLWEEGGPVFMNGTSFLKETKGLPPLPPCEDTASVSQQSEEGLRQNPAMRGDE